MEHNSRPTDRRTALKVIGAGVVTSAFGAAPASATRSGGRPRWSGTGADDVRIDTSHLDVDIVFYILPLLTPDGRGLNHFEAPEPTMRGSGLRPDFGDGEEDGLLLNHPEYETAGVHGPGSLIIEYAYEDHYEYDGTLRTKVRFDRDGYLVAVNGERFEEPDLEPPA